MSERITLLVTVKAYPAISTKYGEVVCVAGIRTDTESPSWVRLFPVPFRQLPFDSQFKKYQEITVEVERPSTDTRPETRRPDPDSLVLGREFPATGAWEARRAFVEPVIVESMCWLQRQQAIDRTSLGAFRPREVTRFVAEREDATWTSNQEAVIAQPSLFYPVATRLERIPYRFRYEYLCSDLACRGHAQSIVDWELAEAYRSWNYEEAEKLAKLRQKWLEEMCGPTRDTVFFVGNQHVHEQSVLVLGVFYPEKLKGPRLL